MAKQSIQNIKKDCSDAVFFVFCQKQEQAKDEPMKFLELFCKNEM